MRPPIRSFFYTSLPFALIPLLSLADPSDPDVEHEVGNYFGPGAQASFVAQNGIVSTSSHPATMAALDILRTGGNAFDAAAVAQFVLTVSEPFASGIGGGAFLVFYDAKTGEVVNLDGREEAPAALSPEAFLGKDGKPLPFKEQATGGMAAGVPGTLAAMDHLLKTRGTITLAQALQPAIRLARAGFAIPEPFAANIRSAASRLSKFPASAKIFLHPDGSPLKVGEIFVNPDLADTFELIAKEGIDVFYKGKIAQDIVDAIRKDTVRPGVITLKDLARYRPVERSPVHTTYRGFDIYGMNMPSSGGVTVMEALNILEQTVYDKAPHGSADSLHLFADAQNLAFADRNRFLADADFVEVPVSGLLSKEYARKRAEKIDPKKALTTPVDFGSPEGMSELPLSPRLAKESECTTHFSIVDHDRNAITVTTTIEQHFGCGIVVPGRGFLLNNELTDFDVANRTDDGHLFANAPTGEIRTRRTALGDDSKTQGGKRPRSSMSPTIILQDGKPRFVLGSPGGATIIGVTLNVLSNLIDAKMDVQVAVNAPRMIARNGAMELETPFYRNEALRTDLEKRGFQVNRRQHLGSVQAIEISPDGWLRGAADPRREGLALGF